MHWTLSIYSHLETLFYLLGWYLYFICNTYIYISYIYMYIVCTSTSPSLKLGERINIFLDRSYWSVYCQPSRISSAYRALLQRWWTSKLSALSPFNCQRRVPSGKGKMLLGFSKSNCFAFQIRKNVFQTPTSHRFWSWQLDLKDSSKRERSRKAHVNSMRVRSYKSWSRNTMASRPIQPFVAGRSPPTSNQQFGVLSLG